LDEMKEKKDIIIIGGLGTRLVNIWMLNALKNYLFTIESLKRCFQILGRNGVLIAFITYPANYSLTKMICASLKQLNIYFRVFKVRSPRKYFIYASRSKQRLDDILSSKRLGQEVTFIKEAPILTDERPFIQFYGPHGKLIIKTLTRYLILIFSLALLGLLISKEKKREKIFYFFLIGNGFFLTQLLMLARFRSFFTHPVRTIIVVTAIFLSAVTTGYLLSHRIKIENLKNKLWLHSLIVGLALLYFYISISHIPFSVSNYFLKMLVTTLTIFPMGIICGFFYPIGLLVNRNQNLGLALLFDGLGTCSAFLLFYIICALSGISANFYIIAFCYILATFLISLRE